MANRDEGGCELKVSGKNDSRISSKRDEKHGSSSRKEISKIKKWRKEHISYAAKMRGGSSNIQGGACDERERVKELLRQFRGKCRDILQENRGRKVGESGRVDIVAGREVKKMGALYKQRTNSPGPVPGVEVGDTFVYRMELMLVGLHGHLQKGIDFVSNGAGERIATSVVASGGYANETSDPNVLIYCGQGGEDEDQNFKNPGNYALKNSISVKNPVRVIRGTKDKTSSRADGTRFVYDGLYKVVAFWRDSSCTGKLLYKFKLVRFTES